MIVHVNRDAVGGALLAVIGAAVAIYSYTNYTVGTIARMGAGMFPAMLGVALIVVAVAIVLKSLMEKREAIHINVRSGATILASLALFALMIQPFGVIPALLALVLVSSFAVPGRHVVTVLVFAIAVTAAITFLFVYVMNLYLPLFRWPL